ncbi:uncharacterized protein PG986_003906 [Apiospora aurea]|uniref:Uncharacterized protein n=1 Tax=Apiospora aurea TaxID=335848 RepID=A0ABR1QLI4_9PEZI
MLAAPSASRPRFTVYRPSLPPRGPSPAPVSRTARPCTDQALAQGLMRIYGVRNVVINLTLFTAWYRGRRGTQGVGLILGALSK